MTENTSQKPKLSRDRDHFPAILENFILVVIVLVVIVSLLDDLAMYYAWGTDFLRVIIILSFIFDTIFTAEFTARSIISNKRGDFNYYILHQRGWVDFLTSIPLLLFVSGPMIIIMLMGDSGEQASAGDFLVILKTAKAIRVTRILRLIRVVKIFGKIQNSESHMTNRHVGMVSTISVVALIFVMILSTFVPFIHFGDRDEYHAVRKKELTYIFHNAPSDEWLSDYLSNSLSTRQDIISVNKRSTDDNIFTNSNFRELNESAYPDTMIIGNYKIRLSYFPADQRHAKFSLVMHFSILAIILAMMLFYSRIFAQQVADPAFVMVRGLNEWGYNFEVRVDPNYRDDEIFELADAFNVRWLPLKNRIRSYREKKQQKKSVLSLNDIL